MDKRIVGFNYSSLIRNGYFTITAMETCLLIVANMRLIKICCYNSIDKTLAFDFVLPVHLFTKTLGPTISYAIVGLVQNECSKERGL